MKDIIKYNMENGAGFIKYDWNMLLLTLRVHPELCFIEEAITGWKCRNGLR